MNDGEATQPRSSAATNTAAQSRPDAEPPVEEMTVGELVFEVSDRASVLIREEIELAKAEVTEKFNALVAGIFVLLALLLAMHGVAWLLNDLVFDNFWAGFLVEAGLFLLIAAGAGLYAYRSLRRGAPPTPDMAIEEAKEIKQAFDGGEET